jgi:hypothetical protein
VQRDGEDPNVLLCFLGLIVRGSVTTIKKYEGLSEKNHRAHYTLELEIISSIDLQSIVLILLMRLILLIINISCIKIRI